jgi:hypothetical protein
LDKRGSVVKLNFRFHECLAGIKADAHHALHAIHRLVLAQPHGAASIGVLLDKMIYGHEGRRPVMLRPVEFHAA